VITKKGLVARPRDAPGVVYEVTLKDAAECEKPGLHDLVGRWRTARPGCPGHDHAASEE